MDKLVTGARSLTAITAVLSVIDAVGVHAVMALNQAHGHLAKARFVASPPPSDRWYRLLEQLERDIPDLDRVSTNSYDSNAANVSEQVCELLVCAAAFFSAETSDLEDQVALLPEDPEHKTLRARLTSIANQAGHTADALLEHAEDGAWQELLDLRSSSNIAEAILGTAKRRVTNTASANVSSLTIAGPVQAQLPNVRGHTRGKRLLIAAASVLAAFSIGSLGVVHLADGREMATPPDAGHSQVVIPLTTGGIPRSDGGSTANSGSLGSHLAIPPAPDVSSDGRSMADPGSLSHLASPPPAPVDRSESRSTIDRQERSNPATWPVQPAPSGEVLGGFSNAKDLNPYCISQGFTEAYFSGGSWICRGKADGTSDTHPQWPLRMDSACEWAYGAGITVRVKQDTAGNVTSWECIRRHSG